MPVTRHGAPGPTLISTQHMEHRGMPRSGSRHRARGEPPPRPSGSGFPFLRSRILEPVAEQTLGIPRENTSEAVLEVQ